MRMADVQRRQWELWAITLFIIIFFALTVIHLALFTENKSIFLIFLGIFSILFCLYVVEREGKLLSLAMRLQQEERQVLDEQGKVSQLSARLKELAALDQVGKIVHQEGVPQRALEIILASAMELFETGRGSIMVMDEKGEFLNIATARGVDRKWLETPQRADEGVAGWVISTGDPLLLTAKPWDRRFTNFMEKDPAITSAICVPLRVRGKVIGVINCSVVSPQNKTFTEYDLKLLSVFSQYASIAIENAQLRAHLKEKSAA